jgi:Zn-dependent peptidase ImmA (M78 family)
MRGFSVGETPLPVIVLNGQDTLAGKIFTLIHEFTHIILHNGGICDLNDRSFLPNGNNTEVFCNRVAGEVLVPASILVDLFLGLSMNDASIPLDEAINHLSSQFKVSQEVILRRLLITGNISLDYYNRRRSEFVEWYAKSREEARTTTGHPPYFRMVMRRNGTRFTRIVLDAFADDRINISDVSDYLDVKIKHLADIEREAFQRPAVASR